MLTLAQKSQKEKKKKEEAERKKMVKGLLADRQAARYSDEKIRRQSENVTAVGKSAK